MLQLGRLEQFSCSRKQHHQYVMTRHWIHTHTHTHTNKAYSSRYIAIATQYTDTGMPQALEPCAANSPGAELVTCRMTVHVSQIKVTEPTVWSTHFSKQDKDSWAFAFPRNNWTKVSCSRKRPQHQSVLSRNRTCNLSISRPVPWLFGHVVSHTCMHTHTFLSLNFSTPPTVVQVPKKDQWQATSSYRTDHVFSYHWQWNCRPHKQVESYPLWGLVRSV